MSRKGLKEAACFIRTKTMCFSLQQKEMPQLAPCYLSEEACGQINESVHGDGDVVLLLK